jgi:hypothetical protein
MRKSQETAVTSGEWREKDKNRLNTEDTEEEAQRTQRRAEKEPTADSSQSTERKNRSEDRPLRRREKAEARSLPAPLR